MQEERLLLASAGRDLSSRFTGNQSHNGCLATRNKKQFGQVDLGRDLVDLGARSELPGTGAAAECPAGMLLDQQPGRRRSGHLLLHSRRSGCGFPLLVDLLSSPLQSR